MPNQPEEWWNDAWIKVASKHKTHSEIVGEIVAEADRRATLRTWEEAKELVEGHADAHSVVAPEANPTAVCDGLLYKINSRIQQYGNNQNMGDAE